MRKLLLIFGILLVASAAFFFFRPKQENGIPSPQQIDSASPNLSSSTNSSSASAIAAEEPAEPSAPVASNFSQRLAQQAVRMDAQKMDFTELEGELEAWAKNLSDLEKKSAAEKVKEKAAPANERVLSAYLLGKAGAWPELTSLIAEPFERERAEPHSVGEMNSMKELSLRYMEIDFLADGAKKNPSLIGELLRLRNQVRDPSLSRHLERRLKELGQ